MTRKNYTRRTPQARKDMYRPSDILKLSKEQGWDTALTTQFLKLAREFGYDTDNDEMIPLSLFI